MEIINISDELKDDEDIMYAAVKHNPNSFEFASDRLKDDDNIVVLALQDNGRTLEYASEGFKKDKDVVTAAVMESYYSLEYADTSLIYNMDFVSELIKKKHSMKKFAMNLYKKQFRSTLNGDYESAQEPKKWFVKNNWNYIFNNRRRMI